MIRRIVKMTFHPEKVDTFLKVYKANWHKIRNFEGCTHMELLQDENDPSVFFTFTIWESNEHLTRYRKSEVFATIWSATKLNFRERRTPHRGPIRRKLKGLFL